MADKARNLTDKILADMEKNLSAIYFKEQKYLYSSFEEYFKPLKKEAEKLLNNIAEAKTDKEKTTAKNAYKLFVKKSILADKKFKDLSKNLSNRLYETNLNAVNQINEKAPEIYVLNYNAIGKNLENDLVDYTLHEATQKDVELYGNLTKQTLSKTKDTTWNNKNIRKGVLAGALLFLPLEKIFDRTSKNVAKKNFNTAKTYACGQTTDAESKGRLDSFYRASDEGYGIEKTWIAILDNRTRHSHRNLDGKTIPLDDEFLQGLSRPKDPNGRPEEVCNCRCTLGYKVGQKSSKTRFAREGEVTGSYKKSSSFKGTTSVEIKNMTYEEWAKWRKL